MKKEPGAAISYRMAERRYKAAFTKAGIADLENLSSDSWRNTFARRAREAIKTENPEASRLDVLKALQHKMRHAHVQSTAQADTVPRHKVEEMLRTMSLKRKRESQDKNTVDGEIRRLKARVDVLERERASFVPLFVECVG